MLSLVSLAGRAIEENCLQHKIICRCDGFGAENGFEKKSRLIQTQGSIAGLIRISRLAVVVIVSCHQQRKGSDLWRSG